jgi:multiple antibiotic resistance protein
MISWFVYVGATFGALFPIMNPFSTAPVFLAVTERFTAAQRRQQAKMAAIYAASVLLVALFTGALVLEFFGITLPMLRIGGGLIIARVGFGMVSPEQKAGVSAAEQDEAQAATDVAFTPIAMPLLSGPGSIAATIAMATVSQGFVTYSAEAVGIGLVALSSWIVLRYSGRILEFIGTTGMNVMTRMMGFLLVCIGVQFVGTGLVQGLTSDAMMEVLRDWQMRWQAG